MPTDARKVVSLPGWRAALAACALLSVLFVARAWRQVPVGDQVFDLVSADCLAKGSASEYLDLTVMTYPPGYMLAVSSVMKISGLTAAGASKAVGAACWAVSILLLVAAVLKLNPGATGSAAAAVAAVLYLTSPAAIQGTQVLKQDTTVLTVALLAFFLLFACNGAGRGWRGLLLLGACYSLVLWAKSTTALAIPVALLAYYAADGGLRGAAWKTFIVFCGGMLLFFFTWLLLREAYGAPFSNYPFFCHFDDIFREYGARMTKTMAEQVHEWLKGGLVGLWFSPYLCLLWVVAAWRRLGSYFEKGRPEPQDLPLLISAVIIGGYGIAGGLAHGFPRYQVPALSFCLLTAALYCAEQFPNIPDGRQIRFAAALAAAALLAGLLVSRDVIHETYYLPRLAASFPGASPVPIIPAMLRALLCVPLAAAGYFTCRLLFPELGRGARHVMVLVPLALGANLGQDIIQFRAPYLTAYTYGADGVGETFSLLAVEAGKGRRVLAPDDIRYHLPGEWLGRRTDDWVSPAVFIGQIIAANADVVAYGLPSNSVSQYARTFNRPETLAFLSERFSEKREVGAYTVWSGRRDGR